MLNLRKLPMSKILNLQNTIKYQNYQTQIKIKPTKYMNCLKKHIFKVQNPWKNNWRWPQSLNLKVVSYRSKILKKQILIAFLKILIKDKKLKIYVKRWKFHHRKHQDQYFHLLAAITLSQKWIRRRMRHCPKLSQAKKMLSKKLSTYNR